MTSRLSRSIAVPIMSKSPPHKNFEVSYSLPAYVIMLLLINFLHVTRERQKSQNDFGEWGMGVGE
jgi:hypothetical protein